VTSALQAYADRGVFRGFRAVTRGGRTEYEFRWLTRRPVRAVLRANRLTFPALFPALDAAAASELAALVASRTARGQPAHKRVDARRARLDLTRRRGHVSLAVEFRGHNAGYGVRAVLNLINELFVALHERHPEYLIEQFGVSAE
jgi:hypothetical protein